MDEENGGDGGWATLQETQLVSAASVALEAALTGICAHYGRGERPRRNTQITAAGLDNIIIGKNNDIDKCEPAIKCSSLALHDDKRPPWVLRPGLYGSAWLYRASPWALLRTPWQNPPSLGGQEMLWDIWRGSHRKGVCPSVEK